MCVLRVSGETFEVDRFLSKSNWVPLAVFRPGEPKTRLSNESSKQSGFNVSVSDADFSELPKQIADALRFLETNEGELARIREVRGVLITVDFGIEERDVAAQTETFPAELLLLLGQLGISLTFTLYPPSKA